MDLFYRIFARNGLKYDQAGQKVIVQAAQNCWTRGNPLLSAIADASPHTLYWSNKQRNALFQDRFYAHCTTQDGAQALEFERCERQWRDQGRQMLPSYFRHFGVLNSVDYCRELQQRAHDEQRARHQRVLTAAEQRALRILRNTVHDLAPAIMKHFDRRSTNYTVAETDVVLGQLKENRSYDARDVFFSTRVFEADFAEALAVFMHEHAHIFGYDGSRGFSDALTELLETLVRERNSLDQAEAKWLKAQKFVQHERANAAPESTGTSIEDALVGMTEPELRQLISQLPSVSVKRALESSKDK